MNENKEEFRFVPSAASDSAGWHEIKCKCHRQCWKEGLNICDVASTIVEDDGEPHTINLCPNCYNLTQEERKEPAMSGRQWKILADKNSEAKCQLKAFCPNPSFVRILFLCVFTMGWSWETDPVVNAGGARCRYDEGCWPSL